ncbi:hypothetical protein ANN_15233 [Periplaneta americana]|uniref:Mariner Mos1 transposase n=1 Tax=Periplaneta americana TaxID=6978 RepID=A0ABQ8SGM2_PERAM|nr:hypothetical protein ANN_15233 [Periplaneta americana]
MDNDVSTKDQFSYRPSLLNAPDLPPWIHYIYSNRHQTGFLYGVPPRQHGDLELEIVGLNRKNYETRRRVVYMNIEEKPDPAKHEVQLKIDNLNVEDMFDSYRLNRLLDVFRCQLWRESEDDLYVTFLASAVHLGARHPLRPNEGEGVVLRIGSRAQFSAALQKLQDEVKPLWKLGTCPRDFKRTTVERSFREEGFVLDWCAFRLIAAVLDIHQKQRVVIEFLCSENETVGNIHKRLKKVYGDAAVDRKGLLLVDIMPHGTTINSDAYVATLKKLQARLNHVRPDREKQDVLLLHNNARPHVSHKTTDQIRKLGWTTLKPPPSSPDLAPCSYHLFGKLKESLRGTRFEDDDFLVHAAKEWFKHVGPDFYCACIQYRPSFQGGVRQLKGMGIMWKRDILFLKNVSAFCENSKAVEASSSSLHQHLPNGADAELPIDHRPLILGHEDLWSRPSKSQVPQRSYVSEFVYTIMVPMLVMIILVLILSLILCFHHEGM